MKKTAKSCYAFGALFYQSTTLHFKIQLKLDYRLQKRTDVEKKFVDRKENIHDANTDLNTDAIKGTSMPYKTFLTTITFVC